MTAVRAGYLYLPLVTKIVWAKPEGDKEKNKIPVGVDRFPRLEHHEETEEGEGECNPACPGKYFLEVSEIPYFGTVSTCVQFFVVPAQDGFSGSERHPFQR